MNRSARLQAAHAFDSVLRMTKRKSQRRNLLELIPPDSFLLNYDEAGLILGVQRKTIQREIKRKKLRPVTLGRKFKRIPWRELKRYMTAGGAKIEGDQGRLDKRALQLLQERLPLTLTDVEGEGANHEP